MKKLLSLLILFVLLLTSCGKKKEETALEKILNRDLLIVGVKTDAKPFGFISETTGENAGFDIDVARYVAQDLLGSERKVKFVGVDASSRIEAITSEQVDIVIATMSIDQQRQLFIDFSKPYYIAGQTALIKEDSDVKTFADLARKTTIVVLGTTAEKNLRRIIPTAKIIGYKTNKEAFQAFENGIGDAISNDDTILSGFLINHSGYKMLRNRISREPYAIGLKKSETDDNELKRLLDIIITRMHKDGTIKELKNKWQLK